MGNVAPENLRDPAIAADTTQASIGGRVGALDVRSVYELIDANGLEAYIVANDESEARNLFTDISTEEATARELPPDEVLHIKRGDDQGPDECSWSECAMTARGWADDPYYAGIIATRGDA